MSKGANFSTINEAIRETYEGPSKWKVMFTYAKRLCMAYLLGAAMGAYYVYNLEHRVTEHLKDIAARGWCGQRDIEQTLYWFACQDAAIANELNQRDMAHDQETAAILSDMGSKKRPLHAKPKS